MTKKRNRPTSPRTETQPLDRRTLATVRGGYQNGDDPLTRVQRTGISMPTLNMDSSGLGE